MANEMNLVNLGKLSKPVNTLILKISDAIGVLYEPSRIVKKAKAESKANEIMAISELKIQDIHKRALSRVLFEETQKQVNIESIIENAIPYIKSDAKTDEMEIDWLVKFFEHAKLVSDEELKYIWSKILAEESNEPGTYTKRTLNILSELEKADAILFNELCKFKVDNNRVFVFDHQDLIYNNRGINFITLHHLEDLGLIKFNSITGFALEGVVKKVKINYNNQLMVLEFKNDNNNTLNMGMVMLTKEGEQLVSLIDTEGEVEILEYITNKLKEQDIEVTFI